MDKLHNPELTHISKVLRKNATKEENHLWYDFLKEVEPQFKRQKVIGKYIVDFYCPAAKMVIELDGTQHNEAKNKLMDEERDEFLKELGIAVFRYSNRDINKNFGRVCTHITNRLKERLTDNR